MDRENICIGSPNYREWGPVKCAARFVASRYETQMSVFVSEEHVRCVFVILRANLNCWAKLITNRKQHSVTYRLFPRTTTGPLRVNESDNQQATAAFAASTIAAAAAEAINCQPGLFQAGLIRSDRSWTKQVATVELIASSTPQQNPRRSQVPPRVEAIKTAISCYCVTIQCVHYGFRHICHTDKDWRKLAKRLTDGQAKSCYFAATFSICVGRVGRPV